MKKISTKKHWREYWESGNHQPLVMHEELLNNLQAVTEVRGEKILEIGAGMGGDSIYLAKQGAKVTALDFTKEALLAIKKNATSEGVRVDTVQADARNLPFSEETFNIIFHQGFLEHFPKPKEILREQARVLKKGGYLVVDVPQRYTTYTIKKHLLMRQDKWFAGWEREFSIRELEKLVKQVGLKPVRTYGWGYYGKLYVLRHLRLGRWYQKLWEWIERTRIKLYLCWCIGLIAQKH